MSQLSGNNENIELLKILTKAKTLYTSQKELYCPYFEKKVTLNAEGFNHLQYKPTRVPRTIAEQLLKLRLLKPALEIIPKCGTLQEYRVRLEKIEKPDSNGFYKTKTVQYWGFHAILKGNNQKIKVIVKQKGDGNIIFWSVMPFNQKLYSEGISSD